MKKLHLFILLFLGTFMFSCGEDSINDDSINNLKVEQVTNRSTKIVADVEVKAFSSASNNEEKYYLNGKFENTIDNNLNTFWHSNLGRKGAKSVEGYYLFRQNTNIDYIEYYPRQDGNKDGNFGLVNFYVSYDNATFQKIASHDFAFSSEVTKVVFPKTIENIIILKVEVISGYNGYASAAEIKFFTKGDTSEETNKPEVGANDKLQKAMAAVSSSQETSALNGRFLNSIDNDLNTFWRTKSSDRNASSYEGYYLFFAGATIDYVLYQPRKDGNKDGNFGKVNFYVSYDSNIFELIASHDFGFSNDPAKVSFPKSLVNPTTIKIEVLSGYNGYASAAEVSFYQKGDGDNEQPEPEPQPENEGTKIQITAVGTQTASNPGVSKITDSNPNTYWQTSVTAKNQFPVTLLTFLNSDKNKTLDYIIYHPRRDGSKDGNWGQVNIYGGENWPYVTKIMSYDIGYSSQPVRINLPKGTAIPKVVSFEILSGYNGYASGAEVEFFTLSENGENGSNSGNDNGGGNNNGSENNNGQVIPPSDMVPATLTIPLLGTSYNNGSNININASGASWSSTSSVLSSYFRANKAGKISLYLNYVPNGDGNIIDVTVQGKKHTLTLPKGNGTQMSIPISVVEISKPGYVKIDIQGRVLKGSTYGRITSFGIGGMTDVIHGNKAKDLPAPYSTLYYDFAPTGSAPVEWFYNEVTIPAGYDPTTTYYEVNGFLHGYSGIQVNSPTERRLLFSVWSPYDTQNPNSIPEQFKVKFISSGPGVKRNQFGNEGSGSQALLVYNWKTAATYKFLTGAKPMANGSTQYVCYYFAPEIGEWRLLAKMERPYTRSWYLGAYSFVENWGAGTNGNLTRKAYYGNQWARTSNGRWYEITKARFEVHYTHENRRDYAAGADSNGFWVKSGGYFDEYTETQTRIERPAKRVPPAINFNALPQ